VLREVLLAGTGLLLGSPLAGCGKVSGLDDIRVGGSEEAPCAAGLADCDGDPKNGCETPLGTAADCSACGDACSVAGGEARCQSGACVISSCVAGLHDCDGEYATGCETALGTEENCGGCADACAVAHGVPICEGGSCAIATCSAGFGDCDDDYATGCETPLNTTKNCGSCKAACAVAHGVAACQMSTCSIAACAPGFEDCDLVGSTGCEIDLMTDPLHCGSCDKSCPVGAACDMGSCVCPAGEATVCSGVCVTLQADPANCGSCGHGCVGGSCLAGACQPVVLQAGIDYPLHVAVDGPDIAWNFAGGVEKCSTNGGAVTVVSQDTYVGRVRADAGKLVWVGVDDQANGYMKAAPLAGGAPVTIYSNPYPSKPHGLWVAAGYAYTAELDFGGYIKASVAGNGFGGGGPPQSSPDDVAADASFVYLDVTQGPNGPDSGLYRFGGGSTLWLADVNLSPLALDTDYVYGAVEYPSSMGIIRVPIGGGGSYVTLYPGGGVSDIWADGADVYWTNAAAGTVMKVPRAGGAATVLAMNQPSPFGIATDADCIYWTNSGDGTLMKLAK
jgi:hypothetical protein